LQGPGLPPVLILFGFGQNSSILAKPMHLRPAIFTAMLALASAASAQLVLNNGVIVNVNGGTVTKPATIVLHNPPATPIARLGATTSQGIMLESEYNRVQYNLDQGTTAITVPYISNTTGSWVPFPMRVYGITAGTRSPGKTAAIRFSSTKPASLATGWDNYNYRPSQVLNMCGGTGACVNNSNANNNSNNAIDRFWVIEPVYYNSAAQRPACTFDFTYIMQETNTNAGNTASLAAALQPQRFDTINTGSSIWGWNGFPSTTAEMGTNTPGAMTATGVGTLTNVSVTAANFFPDWTLANKLVVLPVQLVDFSASCENYNTSLSWVSAQETNADYYTIEKSTDGSNFHQIGQVKAIGNSNQSSVYTFLDMETLAGIVYYRLSETDRNGATEVFQKLAFSDCANSDVEKGDIYSYQENVFLNLFSLSDQQVRLNAFDVTGRLILQQDVPVVRGFNHVKLATPLAQGVYLFDVQTSQVTFAKKIFLGE
jgi:hypothetical protein